MPVLSVFPFFCLLSLSCLLLYKYFIYPTFLSPLSRIPAAHPTASFNPLWILYIRHQFRENRTIEAAHKRFGPVIRLGPNELSVNCVDGGIRTIYAGGYEKHQWYANLFSNYNGVHTMFSTSAAGPHGQRKRLMTNVHSKSYLQASSTMHRLSEIIIYERLLPLLRSKSQHGGGAAFELDAYHLLNCSTVDFVTAYQFGLCNGANFLQNEAESRWYLDLYQSRKHFTFWPQELPEVLDFFSRWLRIHLVPTWVADANVDIENWTLRMVDAAETKILSEETEQSPPAQPENIPVVYQQLRNALKAQQTSGKTIQALEAPPNTPMRLLLASELLDQGTAGHETSAITLTYLFHELALHQDIQDKLHAELLTLSTPIRFNENMSSSSNLPPAKEIDSLPYLHAVTTETLRLHAAIPGPQPRVTPRTANGKGVTLGPFSNIPAGVRVSSNPHCLHREASVFPEPNKWLPDRWLEPNDTREGASRDEKTRWLWAFSSGGRMCIGNHLAMQNMKVLTAAIISNYRLEVADDSGIEQEDAYTAKPVGKKLDLRFEPWH